MAEKNILAYFKDPQDAEEVAAKLKAMRAIDVQVDRISRFPGEPVSETFNPISGNISGLGALTSDADVSNKDVGVLIAADVTASGMSDGGQDPLTGRDILLVAVVDEEIHHQALNLIEQSGGMV
ncbi:hypothetical protein [Paenibacillus sp. J2TS4]|uniref:hypothetical protein n=1 Tax=Paenibacillus sp. J2TS4 TaxID=2807194 RepID=UPI001B163381|nr:hypothetical protein [Paenibacillus sp. J2TS4]GIP35852.1 hypothetical protein J2TS4_50620 [Paenibacillus sp. J2TS4]